MAILALPSGISSSRINDVPADADSATLKQLALASDIAQKWLADQPPRRVIVVLGKIGESGAMKPRWPLEMCQATLKNSGRGVIFPGSYRCWSQPVVVWIDKPPEGHQSNKALTFIQVA